MTYGEHDPWYAYPEAERTTMPLPEPLDYCYEWDGPYGSREFSSRPRNGRKPDRSVPIYSDKQVLAIRDAAVREAVERERAEKERLRAALQRIAAAGVTASHPGHHNNAPHHRCKSCGYRWAVGIEPEEHAPDCPAQIAAAAIRAQEKPADEQQPAEAQGWRPIDEETPLEERVLLASAIRGYVHIAMWGSYCQYNSPQYTHWQPLPPAPQEKA